MSPHSTRAVSSVSSFIKHRISQNGFLPSSHPLERLPDDYYQPWEDIMSKLPILIEAEVLREKVDALPILSTRRLIKEVEWQRAYVLLAFLTHAYIWGGQIPSERLPSAISIPFQYVANRLELPPVATYAGLNLWNWRPISEDCDISNPENLQSLHTFTGSQDEAWFYLVSVAMEARAASILPLMLKAAEAADMDTPSQVISSLIEFSQRIKEVEVLLERMDERCNPQYFYHRIRPFLAGSRNMEAAGLPNGVFYEEQEGKGEWKKYRGGSNAQSSLIQFFDVVLGVEHPGAQSTAGFHQEMRSYMPGPHASFLEEVGLMTNIRGYVDDNKANTELRDAFNGAIEALKTFRNKHIQLVTRYIVIPSKSPAPEYQTKRFNLASASSSQPEVVKGGESPELHGTGGTKLIPFLSLTRDETEKATV